MLDIITLAFVLAALLCNLCSAAVDAWRRWRAMRSPIAFPPQKTVAVHLGDEIPWE